MCDSEHTASRISRMSWDERTGNISYEQSLGGQPAGQLNIKYVVFDQGDVIQGLPTNSGGVLACSLKRINLSEDD